MNINLLDLIRIGLRQILNDLDSGNSTITESEQEELLNLIEKQLINTISHEYFHLICHLSTALDIEDEEELAKLNGDLNMRSYEFVEKLQKKQVHQ